MKRYALILLLLPLLLSACATVGSTPPSTGYNIFFSPGQHIKKLIEEKNYVDAEKVYDRENDYFNKNPTKYSDELRNLAINLNNILIPEVNELSDLIQAIKWPEPPDKWHNISNTIGRVDKFIYTYDCRNIFNDTKIFLPSISHLRGLLAAINKSISENVEQAFYEYPHSENWDFFRRYPIQRTITTSMLGGFSKHLLDESRTSNRDFIRNINNIYKQYFGDSFGHALAELYYTTVLNELNEKGKPRFANLLIAINETKTLNTALKSLPGSRVKVIDATSSTMTKQGECDFPTSIHIDLPFSVENINDPIDILRQYDDLDIIIIIDNAVSRSSQVVLRRDEYQSEFKSGVRSDPNPDYNMAQNIVNNARQAVLEAQMHKSSIDSQYCYGAGCWAKLTNQILAVALINTKNKELQEAMQRLNVTPMTVEAPVYQQYKFHKVQIASSKDTTLNYYVIDKYAGTYYAGTLDTSKKRNFTVTYDLHKFDKIRSSHLYGCDSEEDISKFGESPLTINISAIVEKHIADESNHVLLPSKDRIREDILERRVKTLASREQTKYEAKPKKNDKRFESVVIVNNLKGSIGAGFFVSDDVIITNYHVIEGAKYVEIKLFNGQETFGKIIDHDIRLDLALIKSQARGIPLEMYEGKSIELGYSVEAIGHPTGLEFSITRGVVSGIRKIKSTYAPGSKEVDFIQTDAAINPGNSGGPLFLDDKVIGVNTQKLAAVSVEGIGFAIHHAEVYDFIKRSLEKVK